MSLNKEKSLSKFIISKGIRLLYNNNISPGQYTYVKSF